ncbi:MAG: hypothetical protein HY841_03110 [Bacteroidetes bacterium]|nr:hypothetical protein [Bacteroidota bacterium]
MNLSTLLSKLQQAKINLWGITVYEMVGDGCLNGLGSNNDMNNGERFQFVNEIARKKDGSGNIIEGTYSVAWIEPRFLSDKNHETLKIIPDDDGTYKVQWIISEHVDFEGAGIKTGEKQFTVFYWSTK